MKSIILDYLLRLKVIILIDWLIAVKDINFIKCLLKNRKLEEAQKTIQEIRETCPEEDKAELFHLSMWCKLLLKKSDFEADLKELQKIGGTWLVKSNILELR